MKNFTRKSLDELAKIMPVLSEEEQQECWGGGTQSCVFNCYSYLGKELPASFYYERTLEELGYEPFSNGGVPTSDIGKIAAFGGLTVNEVRQNDQFTLHNGFTDDGSQVMMTFNKDGIDHAVVVLRAIRQTDGTIKLYYYDPTIGKRGERVMGDYSGLYYVKPLIVDSPVSVSTSTSVSVDPNQSNYYG